MEEMLHMGSVPKIITSKGQLNKLLNLNYVMVASPKVIKITSPFFYSNSTVNLGTKNRAV